MIPDVKDRLYYEDGLLYWKKSYFSSKVGKPVADTKDKAGYSVVKVQGKTLKYHRVVWFLCKGFWPEGWLDHIDRNKSNNRIENLREVSFSQSNANRGKSLNTKSSKFKGPSYFRGKWKVTCQSAYVGTFDSEIEAAKAYDKKAREVWGVHAKTNFKEN